MKKNKKQQKKNVFKLLSWVLINVENLFLSSLVNVKLIEKKKEKYQKKVVCDAFTIFDLDYRKYTIRFIEASNKKRIFQDCIKLGSQSDGIILMYSLKYDFPLEYFNKIFYSIGEERKKIKDKDKKPITLFILQNEGIEFNTKEQNRQTKNAETLYKFLNVKNSIYLGQIRSLNKENNYKE